MANTPHVVDLFGHIAITVDDVARWLVAVPRIDPQSPSAKRYVRGWAVVDKCQRFAAAGKLDDIIGATRLKTGDREAVALILSELRTEQDKQKLQWEARAEAYRQKKAAERKNRRATKKPDGAVTA